MFQSDSFTVVSSVVPVPLIEETLPIVYTSSFVKDKVSVTSGFTHGLSVLFLLSVFLLWVSTTLSDTIVCSGSESGKVTAPLHSS